MNTQLPTIDALRPLATSRPWTLCAVSRGQWFRLARSGKTPLPSARLGERRPVYLVEELKSWLEAGAPDRATWVQMRKAELVNT